MIKKLPVVSLPKLLFVLVAILILWMASFSSGYFIGWSNKSPEFIEVEIPVIPEWVQELFDYDPYREPMTYDDAIFFLARMRKSHVYRVEHAEELGYDRERIDWELEEVRLYERLIEFVKRQ